MSEEQQTHEPAASEGTGAEALQRSVEALERKNQELIAELRAAKKSKAPDGVNVEELLAVSYTHLTLPTKRIV